ncbi:hypothetical protein GCM10010116_19510 [Microbispora rosea subsp. aerata]|nr:hypothetical protein GCM10010116_19510 [Microbispora rosea subsp. aerata]GIH53433.1 hypothetical protein Mro02_03470 [Microbispora rosea subsp. aerata]GLJ83115.1 hypothetical protein GCM10017588_18410 [Microbispora rosea subsp. aerata]
MAAARRGERVETVARPPWRATVAGFGCPAWTGKRPDGVPARRMARCRRRAVRGPVPGRAPSAQLTSGYGGAANVYETVPLRIEMTNATLALRNSSVSKIWGDPWTRTPVTHADGKSSA